MNNFQMENILSSTKYVTDIFMGDYSVDTLPKYVDLHPSCYDIIISLPIFHLTSDAFSLSSSSLPFTFSDHGSYGFIISPCW